jgi:hypothetical protein
MDKYNSKDIARSLTNLVDFAPDSIITKKVEEAISDLEIMATNPLNKTYYSVLYEVLGQISEKYKV